MRNLDTFILNECRVFLPAFRNKVAETPPCHRRVSLSWLCSWWSVWSAVAWQLGCLTTLMLDVFVSQLNVAVLLWPALNETAIMSFSVFSFRPNLLRSWITDHWLWISVLSEIINNISCSHSAKFLSSQRGNHVSDQCHQLFSQISLSTSHQTPCLKHRVD